MKKTDWIFIFIFLLIISIFIIPYTRTGFENLTDNYPYIMGFIKTSILASYGELLASRILTGNYFSRKGIIPRFIVWGILGMGFVLMFKIFSSGVIGAMSDSILPNVANQNFLGDLYRAFMTSLIMNLIFAPTFMILHRITDTYIDLKNEGKKQVKTNDIIERIDWNSFFGFVVFKTIPLFWVPAHTITFMLPENYRVLMAGFLSIALGLILTFTKMKHRSVHNNEELS
ncbi:hypothetical protein ACAG96_08495 [Candidatus Izemoplasma sp. B36]|uniref:hypothetical protein n=1 Tax=Candidatus Izemoplasma sp. B36 TaxID=3242468 RepID=UPI0035581210